VNTRVGAGDGDAGDGSDVSVASTVGVDLVARVGSGVGIVVGVGGSGGAHATRRSSGKSSVPRRRA
jgi:hypothetical protein